MVIYSLQITWASAQMTPDYKLSVENGGIFLQNNDGNFSANYRKSITNTVGENEIHGNGGGSKW